MSLVGLARLVWVALTVGLTWLYVLSLQMPRTPDQVGGEGEVFDDLVHGGLAMLLGLFALVGAGAAVVFAMAARNDRGKARRAHVFTALAALLPVGSCIGTFGHSLQNQTSAYHTRMEVFRELGERSRVLVDAIGAFDSDHGRPPFALVELVPEYLDGIPSTGLERHPDYDYRPFRSADFDPRVLVWDLGIRPEDPPSNHRNYWLAGNEHTVRYFLGKNDLNDASILAILLEGDRVLGVDTDRLPANRASDPFDSAAWHTQPKSRIDLLDDLLARDLLVGRSLEYVGELLGPWDAETTVPEAPWREETWELEVFCPPGLLKWDRFFYWPTETYPGFIYGGDVERLGSWAYVHE